MLMNLRKKRGRQSGFTLVELMVVIAVIGILVAIAIPRFTSAIASAQMAKVKADLRTIDSAIAMFQANNPTVVPTDGSAGNLIVNVGNGITTSGAPYLAAWPAPPATSIIISGTTVTGAAAYTIANQAVSGMAVYRAVWGAGNTAETLP